MLVFDCPSLPQMFFLLVSNILVDCVLPKLLKYAIYYSIKRLVNILLFLLRYALRHAGPSTAIYIGKPCRIGWAKNLCPPIKAQ
jgi:hypothetical protein